MPAAPLELRVNADDTPQALRVGAVVWKFDSNRRVYRRRKKGDKWSVTGAPVWRRYWTPRTITGETSRSWITNLDEKIPKKGPWRGWAFSEAHIDEIAWIEDNLWKISERFRTAAGNGELRPDEVRQIARIVGYVSKPPETPEGEGYCPKCDGVGWLDRADAIGRHECDACNGTGFPL